MNGGEQKIMIIIKIALDFSIAKILNSILKLKFSIFLSAKRNYVACDRNDTRQMVLCLILKMTSFIVIVVVVGGYASFFFFTFFFSF